MMVRLSGNPWLEVAKLNKDYNLIAVAYTPWHAISIDVLILYLQTKGIRVNPAIVLAEHPQTGWGITIRDFTNDCATYFSYPHEVPNLESIQKQNQFGFFKRIRIFLGFYKSLLALLGSNVFNWMLKKHNCLYYSVNSFFEVSTIWELSSLTSKRVIVAYTEEGVASYMGTLSHPYSNIKKHSCSALRHYIRYFLFGVKFYDLINYHESVKLFKNTRKGLVINEPIISYYKDVLTKNSLRYINTIDFKSLNGSIIICTTAWERKEIIEDEDYEILKLVTTYLRGNGFKLFIKPHPRDSFFREKIKELQSDAVDGEGLTIECICLNSQPRAIISFSSTTLITPRILGDTQVYSISHLLNLNKIGDDYKREMACFEKTFGKFISFVDDIEDLNKIK